MIPYHAPEPSRMRGRGQLTIPKDIRQSLKLDESTILNVFALGNCIIATPKRLERAALSKELRKTAKKEGVSLEDLLKDLKRQRRRYNKETYGL